MSTISRELFDLAALCREQGLISAAEHITLAREMISCGDTMKAAALIREHRRAASDRESYAAYQMASVDIGTHMLGLEMGSWRPL